MVITIDQALWKSNHFYECLYREEYDHERDEDLECMLEEGLV